ncbi:MAG: DUF4192 family protein [Pseudonocardiaceae bacterium]|nr:DUF4192 family protein [Pseudonocardiaceae bacterium]
MTTSLNDPVRLSDPGDLIAATGYLLGFQPADSIVMIGHRGSERNRVGTTLRADLPPPKYERALAEQLTHTVSMQDISAVTLVVIGGKSSGRSKRPPPYARLISTVTLLLEAEGIALLHAMWVPRIAKGAGWRCYQDRNCGGTLPDPQTSAVAAASAANGTVTYRSRAELANQLRPAPDEVLARRAAMLDERLNGLESGEDPADVAYEPALATVREALEASGRDSLSLTDEFVVRLGMALSNRAVRDHCLTTALPVDGTQAVAAERLWLDLTRAMPEPERAEPACLLGYAAYMRGDGAFAGMALEVALDACPGHLLSALLKRALEAALPPKRLAALATPKQADETE